MVGYFERQCGGQSFERLEYKTLVEAVVNGQYFQGVACCDVHFGTDSILENQRHYPGFVRTLQGIVVSGKNFYDFEPHESRAINFLLHSQHGPLTRSPEDITIELPGEAAVRHIENTFADPVALKQIYGNVTYWRERHHGLRPKEPSSTQFRLKYIRRTLNQVGIISVDSPIIHGFQEEPRELWELTLNYYWRNIYIDHKFLTWGLSPQEAVKFINGYEATDANVRRTAFLQGLEDVSGGIFRFPSLRYQL